MDDVLVALDAPRNQDQARCHHHFAETFERLGPDDGVGHTCFVLDGHEHHALGAARPLTHEHNAGHTHERTIFQAPHVAARGDALRFELVAQKTHGMGFERQPQRLVVVDDVLGERHGGERDGGLGSGFLCCVPGKERQWRCVGERLYLPQGLTPVEAHRAERISRGELFKRRHSQARPHPEIVDGRKLRRGSRGDEFFDFVFLQTIDLAETQA